ncbi:ATP-binding cassette domain-containing protein [Streptomyces cinerochromogenes]|uniref:ATP-binding cassette domain-containing protein n=1 Tax=Streptomyces cinerochromogenes TaxID=66422 RepID=UPI0033BB3004
MSASDVAIHARGVAKSYGKVQALRGLDLTVPKGVVYGLLGPNGSGKTTAVKCLTTLVRFDSGTARVCGFDVAAEPEKVRNRIGLTGQYAAVDELLTGRENLVMFGKLAGFHSRYARTFAGELLERFDLVEAADRPVGQYSGGMRRRVDLALSMLHTPEVLVLDEPTTGLDPQSRNQVWSAVRELIDGGTTVLLTTQYLEEADQLAARIAVLQAGAVIAEGTADELKAQTGGDQITVVVRTPDEVSAAAQIVGRASSGTPQVAPHERRISAPVTDRTATLAHVLRELEQAGIRVEDIGIRRPTLDEVFLSLTDRKNAKSQTEVVSS